MKAWRKALVFCLLTVHLTSDVWSQSTFQNLGSSRRSWFRSLEILKGGFNSPRHFLDGREDTKGAFKKTAPSRIVITWTPQDLLSWTTAGQI
jgi:cell shape-determining protein MreC